MAAGTNWRLVDDTADDMIDWVVEPCSHFGPADSIVYSALSVLSDGAVRHALMIREIGSLDWWGDSLEYEDGAWHEAGALDGTVEEFVAEPHADDASFTGEYDHAAQRRGFRRWSPLLTTRRRSDPSSASHGG